jgi:hypothetical protein
MNLPPSITAAQLEIFPGVPDNRFRIIRLEPGSPQIIDSSSSSVTIEN